MLSVAEEPDPYVRESEPESVLPEQFFEGLLRNGGDSGERKLMVALIADACHCFQRYAFAQTPEGKKNFREAAAWLMASDTGAKLEFEVVCDLLGVDAEYVRGRLRRWRARTVGDLGERRRALGHRVSSDLPRKRAVGE